MRAPHQARAAGAYDLRARGVKVPSSEPFLPPHRRDGTCLVEIRRSRGLTQQQVAERMGVTKGRISQIEQGKISGQDILARYAAALGGRLHQSIHFDDCDIAAIA
ncbi:helix-turn-helix transcriptional regulator [Microbispora sp. NBRC 16548]|uniref:helix-turn-helix domain-containing protein n=1 Tax=Microbispora sp. NBRC 16548 TaxID=3030994 RepID=UPI0024A3A8DD|nr:helix-turn-helix transcriptional regulator [Microbispora sp. NBRC 16548]GLX08213.1 hypothetical protein Misp03_51390 [Microbispora sp. NBRC 16548]